MLSAPTPHSCRDAGYRHEAFFYAGAREFLDGTLEFIREAVAASEPILVVLASEKIATLRGALGGDAAGVVFADMADVGANPARIIPAWQEFVERHEGRRMRGIGEPIWAGRSAAELVECERHEALLNVCFADPDFHLLCPYDTATLPAAVLEEARRNHPYVRGRDQGAPSDAFPGAGELGRPFANPLPAVPDTARSLWFDASALRRVREFASGEASRVLGAADAVGDFVFVVHELAANSIRHGGGAGSLSIWQDDGTLICEVRDAGRIEDPLAGRVRPRQAAENGRGLWLANQICDLVQIRTFDSGSAVRIHLRG